MSILTAIANTPLVEFTNFNKNSKIKIFAKLENVHHDSNQPQRHKGTKERKREIGNKGNKGIEEIKD